MAQACKLAEGGAGACEADGLSCSPPPAGTCWAKKYPASGPGPPGHPEWSALCSCLAAPPPIESRSGSSLSVTPGGAGIELDIGGGRHSHNHWRDDKHHSDKMKADDQERLGEKPTADKDKDASKDKDRDQKDDAQAPTPKD